MSGGGRKMLVIGLDSAPPELVFSEFKEELPNLKHMMESGLCAPLESCHPPITVPAWMVMTVGKDPGELGVYGFRHRKGFSYIEGWIPNSNTIKDAKIWDVLSNHGKNVCIVGVPPGYPPPPVNGCYVSCFMTPDSDREYTYPPELKQEIEQIFGPYVFDVEFRVEDRDLLLKRLYDMTDRRFRVIEHLLKRRTWDFFMFVEIGVDRIHHAFWKFFDKTHPKYIPGNKYENVIRDYYRFLDEKIGGLLNQVDADTLILTVSDHGAKGMRGAFCVNEWLIKEGYLALRFKPERVIEIEKADIDWSKTQAWGWGGYYARIFLNVVGREPHGTIPQSDYEKIRTELADRLRSIKDPTGRRMDTRVFLPEKLYRRCKGDKPDLMVYFDDLYWRSAGTIGHDSLYLSENDTGPDDAVHSQEGIFILYDPKKKYSKNIERVNILDIAPTIVQLFGLPLPAYMKGKVIEGI